MNLNKELLVVSGYPRSGNVFLNHCIRDLYFPDEDRNSVDHMTITIQNREKTIVTVRNPEEAIVSWNLFKKSATENNSLDLDIKFYIRYHEFVKNNIQKAVIMDFSQFTKNPEYIEDVVYKNFKINKVKELSIDSIKNKIENDEYLRHLPADPHPEKDKVKQELINSPMYDKCLDLYNNIYKYF